MGSIRIEVRIFFKRYRKDFIFLKFVMQSKLFLGQNTILLF